MAVNSNFGTVSDILTHPDISACIVKRVTNLTDYVRFGSVCKAWRSAALRDRFATVRHHPPGFISTARSLWNNVRFRPISHGGAAYPHRRLRWLRDRSSIRAVSPNCGWLISMNNERFLVNPVTGSRIPLPESGKEGTYSIAKASMTSSAPDSVDSKACYVLVIYDGPVMSICEVGGSDWRYVESGSEVVYRDAIYFEGRFYVLMSNGDVSAIDEDQFGAASPVTRRVARLDLPGGSLSEEELDPEGEGGECSLKLVDIGGELMVLVFYPKRKRMFEIYKLDLSTKDWVCVEESFGDYALFVGDGQAFALGMNNVPDATASYNCIMANHIYFAAAKVEKSFVYSFADFDVRGLCCPQHLTNTLEQAALWFTPVPW